MFLAGPPSEGCAVSLVPFSSSWSHSLSKCFPFLLIPFISPILPSLPPAPRPDLLLIPFSKFSFRPFHCLSFFFFFFCSLPYWRHFPVISHAITSPVICYYFSYTLSFFSMVAYSHFLGIFFTNHILQEQMRTTGSCFASSSVTLMISLVRW